MVITIATPADTAIIAHTYDELFAYEVDTQAWTNWNPHIYPTYETAEQAVSLQDMYVVRTAGIITGSFRINQEQPAEYAQQPWKYPALPQHVLVLHTLCIRPMYSGQGIAHRILDFACRYGRSHGCITFRIDTYAGNMPAAHLYEQYGFRLVSIAPLLLHGSIQENQRFYEYKL